jgi:hypothetical protein
MKKAFEFLKQHKVIIFGVLFVLFFLRSCSRGNEIKKLSRQNTVNNEVIDSLLYINDSISKLVPSQSNISLLKLKVQYDTYDEILNEMTKLQVTCGTFRETHILKPKVEIGKEIKKLEK